MSDGTEGRRYWPSPFNPYVFEVDIAIPGEHGSPFRQARMVLPRDFSEVDIEPLVAFLRDLADRPMFPEHGGSVER